MAAIKTYQVEKSFYHQVKTITSLSVVGNIMGSLVLRIS